MRYTATAVDRENGAEVRIEIYANSHTSEQLASYILDPIEATDFVTGLEKAIADAECMNAGRWLRDSKKDGA